MEHCIAKGSPDAFEVFRLVLPQSDRRLYPGVSQYRFVYLVIVVVRRLVDQFPVLAAAVGATGGEVGGSPVEGDFYSRLFRWRDKDGLALALGEPSEVSEFLKQRVYDAFCGDHSKSEAENDLARRMGQARSPTVTEVNDKLDEFSDASRRYCVEEQADIMEWFMRQLSPRQMMWLTQMVLKRTRVWISERDVLEQAPWGEDAVQSFYAQGRSFEELLNGVYCGISAVATVDADSVGQGPAAKEVRSTRRPQVVLGNVDDAFRYMERRFKPGNYSPMSVIVDAAFDGAKVRICRVQGKVDIELSEDERRKGMPACEGTVVVEAMNIWAVGGKDQGDGANGDVDFDIEADIVAWNAKKGCAEPRFILEALMEADRGLQEGTMLVSDSQPMHMVPRGHLEILVLVTDIVSVGDESMVDQYLQVRQESLAYFGGKRWGAEQGFRVPVNVVPLVPGSTLIAGTPISEVYDNMSAIKGFQRSLEHLGAKGVMLRALEAEWSTVEKMARVQVMNSMGLSIINCAVMGYWKEKEEDVEGRVSHWLLGVADQGDGDGDLSSTQGRTTAILKLQNHLHIMDERAALESLETIASPVPDEVGMYECNPLAILGAQTQMLVSVAGSLLPPGKWSSCPLVLAPTLLGLSTYGSTVTSMVDMCRLAEEKRMHVTREKLPSVRFRERKVADRFIPCRPQATTRDTARNSLLRDYNVYFVNHSTEFVAATTRYEDKKRCEELVHMLGGTLSQNYCQRVNLVIAGQPTIITNKFRGMDIDIMTVDWLERVAAAARDHHGAPLTELPGFLPTDYLPEWDPEEDHRKKMNRNFLDLFTTDGRTTDGDESVAKRFKPTVTPSAMAPVASANDAVARSHPLPQEQTLTPSITTREQMTRVQAPPTDAAPQAAVDVPAQGIAQFPHPTEFVAGTHQEEQASIMEPSYTPGTDNVRDVMRTSAPVSFSPLLPPVPPAHPPGTAPTPLPTALVPALQTADTPSTAQRARSLKERASSVIAMGSSIPLAASPDRERPKKLSLRDRAKRLGLGQKK